MAKIGCSSWGLSQATHTKASQPHFPRFHAYIFRVIALWNLLKSLFFWVERGPSAYSTFSLLGCLREGPPFHESRSLREITIQNAELSNGWSRSYQADQESEAQLKRDSVTIVTTLLCLPASWLLDVPNRQSPIASVQRTRVNSCRPFCSSTCNECDPNEHQSQHNERRVYDDQFLC